MRGLSKTKRENGELCSLMLPSNLTKLDACFNNLAATYLPISYFCLDLLYFSLSGARIFFKSSDDRCSSQISFPRHSLRWRHMRSAEAGWQLLRINTRCLAALKKMSMSRISSDHNLVLRCRHLWWNKSCPNWVAAQTGAGI